MFALLNGEPLAGLVAFVPSGIVSSVGVGVPRDPRTSAGSSRPDRAGPRTVARGVGR